MTEEPSPVLMSWCQCQGWLDGVKRQTRHLCLRHRDMYLSVLLFMMLDGMVIEVAVKCVVRA